MVRAMLNGLLFALFFGMLVSSAVAVASPNPGDTASPVLALAVAAVSFAGGFVLAKGFSHSERRAATFVACSLIDADITFDCGGLTGGVMPEFYLANKEDVASIDLSVTNPMVAELITMVVAKQFFTIAGQLQSLEPKSIFVPGKYINQYDHEITFYVFDIKPGALEQLLNMKDGNFTAIVRNNSTGVDGNSKYDIYGGESGLKCILQERTPNDTENLGAWKVTLKTAEYAREGKPPLRLYDTDSTTTEAIVTGLLTP